MDEKAALEAMHAKQSKIRKTSMMVLILIIALSSVVFVVFPKTLPGMLVQVIMIAAMASVFGLVFLDRVSFTINKKTYRKDILHDYLFTHSKPEDMHKDVELIQEQVVARRKAAQEQKRG